MVFPAAGGSSMWVVYGGSVAASNPFHSGLRYGEAPAGTFEATPARPLRMGIEYRVTLYRWVGDLLEGGPLVRGGASFRP